MHNQRSVYLISELCLNLPLWCLMTPEERRVEVKKKVPQCLVNRMFHLLLDLSNVLTMKKKSTKFQTIFTNEKN